MWTKVECPRRISHQRESKTSSAGCCSGCEPAGRRIHSGLLAHYSSNRIRNKVQGSSFWLAGKLRTNEKEDKGLDIYHSGCLLISKQAALAIFFAFTFDAWFQKLKFFKDNKNFLGVTGSVTNGVLGPAIAIATTEIALGDSLPIQNSISNYVYNVVSTCERTES